MEFQRRARLIIDEKDAAFEPRLAAYIIYLVLHAIDLNVTEDWVIDNSPGDLDFTELVQKLGFVSQQKVKTRERIKDALANQPSGDDSLAR